MPLRRVQPFLARIHAAYAQFAACLAGSYCRSWSLPISSHAFMVGGLVVYHPWSETSNSRGAGCWRRSRAPGGPRMPIIKRPSSYDLDGQQVVASTHSLILMRCTMAVCATEATELPHPRDGLCQQQISRVFGWWDPVAASRQRHGYGCQCCSREAYQGDGRGCLLAKMRAHAGRYCCR
jgi:hypothetical protein